MLRRRRLRSILRPGLRLLLVLSIGALLATPLAVSWAITRTQVEDTIGVSPTTFSLTTSGHSELRLGIAGTVFVPRSRGPLGVVATVEGPTAVAAGPDDGGGDLASYVTPQMLTLYSGLFHDPEPAVHGYIDVLEAEFFHELIVSELFLTLVVGGALLIVLLLLPPRRPAPRRRQARWAGALLVGLVATSTVALWQVDGAGRTRAASGVYALPALDGTAAAGSTTNSPVLRLVLGDAVPKVQTLVRRQEARARAFRDTANQSLAASRALMAGPREGETAMLLQSDMHCNQTMILLQAQVRRILSTEYGGDVPALLAVTGDLTTNGTAAERTCIESEAAIAGGAPVAAVTGNHESDLSAGQMRAAGMTVLDGSTRSLAGVDILGDGDPERTELFGATRLRGRETEADVGRRLYATASRDKPQVVLVHEAYAAQAFLGVSDMTEFLDRRGAPTEPIEDDDVRDLPAAAVFYGHWHRSILPRVVWNSDGTWTLVMELDTSGGAVDTPTIGHFSTPWTPPRQEASFPVVFLDDRTHLVTGYQLYSFRVDGSVSVLPRVEVGDRNLLSSPLPDRVESVGTPPSQEGPRS